MRDLLQKIIEDPSSVIALCALFVSVISVTLSIITARQNRKNNRLSVRPLAYIFPPDFENRIAVIIQNKGTGPLITKELKFVNIDGVKQQYLIDFMPNLKKGYYWSTFSKASKIVLRPSEEKVLLEFVGEETDLLFTEQRDQIRRALSQIKVEMKYTSIFNESKPFELIYKLDWFGRAK